MSTFEKKTDSYHSLQTGKSYKLCKNGQLHQACNWMIDASSKDEFCYSCTFNRTIPNLSIGENRRHWKILESGKRRLLYSLMQFHLPLVDKNTDPVNGMAFEFLKDTFERIQANDRVMTGHVDGVITLNIAEADDAERERLRMKLNEDYRTVLGHFRHESGHYYWQQLIEKTSRLASFRALFGNETVDYQSAISDHHQNGAINNWHMNYISAYASSHPWEDFAETWAHYILIADTLETAAEFSFTIHEGSSEADNFDSYQAPSFDALLERWLPLTLSVNSINRSAGQPDLYPFVLSTTAIRKLTFIHDLIRAAKTV